MKHPPDLWNDPQHPEPESGETVSIDLRTGRVRPFRCDAAVDPEFRRNANQ